MVCNANRFMNIALIIRDNLGKIFVIDYDLSVIPYKSRNNEVIGEEHQPPEVFFNRLKTSKAREFFLKEVGKLKIPLDLMRLGNKPSKSIMKSLNRNENEEKKNSRGFKGIPGNIWTKS